MLNKSFAVLGLCLFTSVQAGAAVIDFESDASGAKANGFVSVSDSGVHFTDTSGSDLNIGNFGGQGDGQSLLVGYDNDRSKLQVDFDFNVKSFSLDFGNDDPNWTLDTDLAWLQIFDGATLVDTISMAMNRDDIMNQTISYSGSNFNRALFWYGNAAGDPTTGGGAVPTGLIEIVDNITYERAGTVPEPATVALLGLGLAGLSFSRRKS